jgi:hypothetical protein
MAESKKLKSLNELTKVFISDSDEKSKCYHCSSKIEKIKFKFDIEDKESCLCKTCAIDYVKKLENQDYIFLFNTNYHFLFKSYKICNN